LNASKQIEGNELVEGSWNQTFIGDVLTFPVRDIALQVNDIRPTTVDTTPIGDLDFTIIYNLNPTSVSDLWAKKSRSFHTFDNEKKDWLLMNAYMRTTANNAAQKVIATQEMLKLQTNREPIEVSIKREIEAQLKKDNFADSLIVTSVRVQNLQPNPAIMEAAVRTVKAQQELATAQAQTELAKQEALRQQALAANSEKTIAYMDAESRKTIAQAIANGKVTTIVLPMDFKGIVNVK
jgi:regulator of protease activity HflC (stomatin/prohibitin superfamily)